MKLIQLLAALLPLHVASSFPAQAHTPSSQAAAKSRAPLTNAEVVDIYPKKGKVLLKHGPIPKIGMGAMPMEFGLKDKKAITT